MSTIPLRNNAYTLEVFNADLSDSQFEDCALTGAQFKHVSLAKIKLDSARLDGARLTNVSFDNATLERVSFVNCAIKFGRYDGMTIEGVPVTQLLKAHFDAHPQLRRTLLAEARAAGVLDAA